MNRLVRGTVLLAAVAAIWSCESDPTGGNAKTIATVQANPSVVFVNNLGDSTAVVVQALNDLNQPDSADFTLGTIPSSIVVNRDTSYGHIIGGGNIPTSARYFVRAASTTGFVNTSFDVSAGGATTTIPVKVTIASIPGAAFSNATPGLGDTVQLTAPAGITFTPATTISFGPNALPGANVGVSTDGSILYVLPSAGIAGDTAILSGVELSYAPGIPFNNITTTATITTDTLPNPLPVVTVSDTMPAVGDTVTVTAPPLYGFTDASEVTLGNGAGNALVDISADRTQLRFIVGPDASGPISVSDAALGGVAHLGTFDLVSADPVNSPPAPALAAAFSTTTPAAAAELSMTAPSQYRFLPGVTVNMGGVDAIVDSVSADSLTLWFVPLPGSTGTPLVSNLVLSFLTTVPLSNIAATTAITVGGSVFTGTDASSTAPTVATPAAGSAVAFADSGTWAGDCGGAPCNWYKFVVTTGDDYTFDATWDNTSDLGTYIVESDATTGVDACDAAGDAPPVFEKCTITLVPGTYYIQMQNFAPFYPDPDPGMFKLVISRP